MEIDDNWVIDKTEIDFIEKIGSGTSSKVYKATFRNEEVGVKVLKDTGANTEEFLKEFQVMR